MSLAEQRPRQRPRRWRWWLVAMLILGALIALRQHRAARRAATAPVAAEPIPITAAAAQHGALPITYRSLGTVTPLATVTVRTRISGYLDKVAFEEGQMVRRGQQLALVDPRPYQVALRQAQATLARDQALLTNAMKDLQRYRQLLTQDSIARQQVDTQESLVRQYRGTVQMDRATVDDAKLNLDYCSIVAPVGGRVGLRRVDVGNYVQPSDQDGLVVITQLDPISVVFTLPESRLPQVLPHLRQQQPLTVTAYDRNAANALATGTLLTLDNQVDPATGTVRAKALFDNKKQMLFPNQFVNAELLIDTRQNTLLIPSRAVQQGAEGPFVYVVRDGHAHVRAVSTDLEADGQTAILHGLALGEQVVTDGVDRLREGTSVQVVPSGQNASTPPETPPATTMPAAPNTPSP
jgi:multidrug efflux system membrane fusion protein